jgi:hypothetical protein
VLMSLERMSMFAQVYPLAMPPNYKAGA